MGQTFQFLSFCIIFSEICILIQQRILDYAFEKFHLCETFLLAIGMALEKTLIVENVSSLLVQPSKASVCVCVLERTDLCSSLLAFKRKHIIYL